VVLGTVVPTLVLVQLAVSAIAFAVGTSTSTKTMMDRLQDASDPSGTATKGDRA
jgi:hypothetical protein